MTITLDIKPEVQAELARQAAATGRPVEAHAASLLEQAVHLPNGVQQHGLGKSLIEVCAMVRGMTDDLDFSRTPPAWRPLELS